MGGGCLVTPSKDDHKTHSVGEYPIQGNNQSNRPTSIKGLAQSTHPHPDPETNHGIIEIGHHFLNLRCVECGVKLIPPALPC